MIYKIPKGKHRAQPLKLGIFYAKKYVAANVTFHENCRYDLNGPDQYDINKLFGIGYLWSVHKDSARFGWYFDPEKQKVILAAYCYVNGVRLEPVFLHEAEFLEEMTLEIKLKASSYIFSVNGTFKTMVHFSHKKKIGYPLNLYFGGNQVAPHEMQVKIKRL